MFFPVDIGNFEENVAVGIKNITNTTLSLKSK